MKNNKKINVYILGAGASKEDGAPLTNEFLLYAFSHIEPIDSNIKIYERLSKKFDDIYGTKFYKGFKLGKTGIYLIPSIAIPDYHCNMCKKCVYWSQKGGQYAIYQHKRKNQII